MKRHKSILDPHEAKLVAWEAQNLSLADMQARLAAEGCKVSLGRLSSFLASRRREADMLKSRAALFGLIHEAAKTNRELDAVFKANPAPELSRLVEVTKSLILDLKMHAVEEDGSVDAHKIGLATTLLKEVTEALKTAQRDKELVLTEAKFRRETCELYLKWRANKDAEAIAAGSGSNADKIEQLGELMFGPDWK